MLFKSRNIYGGFLVALYAVFGMLCNALTHNLSVKVPSFQVLFLKAFSAFIIIALIYLPFKLTPLFKSDMKKWYLIRASFGVLGNIFWIISLQYLTIVNCTSLALSSATFTALGGLLIFSEKTTKTLWFSLFFGLLGVLLIVKPSASIFNKYSFFPLLAALFFSISSLIVKKVSINNSSKTTLIYLMFFMSLLSVVPAVYQWIDLSFYDYIKIIIVGVLYAILNLILIKAYTIADASYIAPFKYLKFPLNVFSGIVFFSESLSISVVLGASIIISSSMIMIFIDKRSKEKLLTAK